MTESDAPNRRLAALIVAAVVVSVVVAVVVAAVLIGGNKVDLDDLQAEGVARRDQTCILFERQELAGVLRVVRSYEYLDALPRSERGSTLTRAIIRGLPDTYREAEVGRAPGYCNEPPGAPQVGLPESPRFSPVLPEERDFRALLDR